MAHKLVRLRISNRLLRRGPRKHATSATSVLWHCCKPLHRQSCCMASRRHNPRQSVDRHRGGRPTRFLSTSRTRFESCQWSGITAIGPPRIQLAHRRRPSRICPRPLTSFEAYPAAYPAAGIGSASKAHKLARLRTSNRPQRRRPRRHATSATSALWYSCKPSRRQSCC